VPLQLESHQGCIGLCTGKPILDVFLTDNRHIYSPPPVPKPLSSTAQPSTDPAIQRRNEFLSMCHNVLSNLQHTTVFRHGPAEKKVPRAALHEKSFAKSRCDAALQVSVFGGLSSKFSSRYLALLTTGELLIYSDKDDFDARKGPEETVSLEDVNAKKVVSTTYPACLRNQLSFHNRPHQFISS
jgi:hypothetical protein